MKKTGRKIWAEPYVGHLKQYTEYLDSKGTYIFAQGKKHYHSAVKRSNYVR